MFGATPTQQKQYMNEAIKSSLMLAGGNAMLKNPIKKPIALGADTIP